MNKAKKDIVGITPSVGDTIAYNPPYYKGLETGKIKSFTKAGCPVVDTRGGSIKSQFVIIMLKDGRTIKLLENE